MNGPDNPSGSEPIYGFPVDDEQVVAHDPETGDPILGPVIEDAGFPSCVYDPHENPFPEPTLGHDHDGNPNPENTVDDDVLAAFGECPKATVLRPRTVLEEGHEGTSGIAFTRGDNFPERYQGDVFIAEWGSLWNLNGDKPHGHKIEQLDVHPDGTVGRQRDFMSGGLPIDVTFSDEGLMYVADMAGQIYEIRHVEELDTPETVEVSMTNGQFVPQVTTVIRGQTVRWVNDDTTAHNVHMENAVLLIDPTAAEDPIRDENELEDLNSGDVPPGGDYSLRFDIPGTYHYSSNGEDAMQATIIVTTLER
jgi:plastocyanin